MKARVVQLSRALAQHSGESATEGGRPRPRQGRPGDLEARNGRNKFPKALPPSFPPSLSSLHFVRNAAFNDGDTTKHDKTRENECSRTRKEARRIRLHLGSRANANANKVTIHCDAGESEMKGRKLATDADKRHHGEEDVERFFSAHARCTAASAAAAVTVSTSQVSQDGRAARFDETPSSLTHSLTHRRLTGGLERGRMNATPAIQSAARLNSLSWAKTERTYLSSAPIRFRAQKVKGQVDAPPSLDSDSEEKADRR